MTEFEYHIGVVMAEHDDEAPRVADLICALEGARRPGRSMPWRRLPGWLPPLAAAAAVAAVIAGSSWAGGLVGDRGRAQVLQPLAASAPLTCPATYAGPEAWVPARPAGVDGRSRLVPRRVPRTVVVCSYLIGSLFQPGPALSGQRVLTGGIGWLEDQLTWEARSVPGQGILCALNLGSHVNYLIGLTYRGGGRLWVSASGGCTRTALSNGEFSGSQEIGPVVGQALRSGRWPARRPASCGLPGLTGRLGQGSAMVPAGSTAVTICPSGARLTSGYGALVSALNSLPTLISTRGCSDLPGPSGPRYRLLFSYPHGPSVQVWVSSGCDPAIDNDSVQAVSPSTILPAIRHLLARR